MDNPFQYKFWENVSQITADTNENNQRYAGGLEPPRLQYTEELGFFDLPAHQDACICGHPIVENCLIVHDPSETLIITGNCCIKRFLTKSGKTCTNCHQIHRNRKDNICNECRSKGYCIYCKKCHPGDCIQKRHFKAEEEQKSKIYFDVRYDQKEKAKRLNALFDGTIKCWQSISDDDIVAMDTTFSRKSKEFHESALIKICPWLSTHYPKAVRHQISVPFEKKEVAKELGARWDPDARLWYYVVSDFNPKLLESFARLKTKDSDSDDSDS